MNIDIYGEIINGVTTVINCVIKLNIKFLKKEKKKKLDF